VGLVVLAATLLSRLTGSNTWIYGLWALVFLFVAYVGLNAPRRYRIHGAGQQEQAVDHKMGVFGRTYSEDQIQAARDSPGRNSRCPCGSGKKYKLCCDKSR
jgi:hypothetical protein